MRSITVTVATGLALTLFSCRNSNTNGTIYPGGESSQELVTNTGDTTRLHNRDTTTKQFCNFDQYFNRSTTSKLAKDIYSDRDRNLDEDPKGLLALLDSLTATDQPSRPFYFKVVTKTYAKADGYYSEGLGYDGWRYTSNNTREFLGYFDHKECFTDSDLQTWSDIVMLELGMGAGDVSGTRILRDYEEKLNANCKECSANQRITLSRFLSKIEDKWQEIFNRTKDGK